MSTINIWFLPHLHLADNFVFFILEIWYSLHETQIWWKKKNLQKFVAQLKRVYKAEKEREGDREKESF